MAKKSQSKWLGRRVAKEGSYLILCLTDKELQKAIKPLTKYSVFFPESGAKCSTFTKETTDELCAVVTLSKSAQQLSLVEVYGLLVHEAVHVWQAYADSIGEVSPGKEQEAYAIQAIAQELMAEYERRT